MLVSDLKVDDWYFDRFTAWTRRLDDAYNALVGARVLASPWSGDR